MIARLRLNINIGVGVGVRERGRRGVGRAVLVNATEVRV